MSSPHQEPQEQDQEFISTENEQQPRTPASSVPFPRLYTDPNPRTNRDLSARVERQAREAERAREAVERYTKAQLDPPRQQSYSLSDSNYGNLYPSQNSTFPPQGVNSGYFPHYEQFKEDYTASPMQTQNGFESFDQQHRILELEEKVNFTLGKLNEKEVEEKRKKRAARKEKQQSFYGQKSGLTSESESDSADSSVNSQRQNLPPDKLQTGNFGRSNNTDINGNFTHTDVPRHYGDPQAARIDDLKNQILALKLDQKNNYTRDLNPLMALNTALKTNKPKMISTNSVSLAPWKEYMETLFASTYLNCISLMQSRKVPKTIKEWKRMDASRESQKSKRATITGFQKSPRVLPNAKELDNVAWLNGIAMAVFETWPVVLNTLHVQLTQTLDPTMAHLKTTKEMTIDTFRFIYFSALFTFHLPATEEKSLQLDDFMSGPTMKYRSHESPEAFALRLTKKAKDTNLIFGTVVISPELLRSRYIHNLRLGTGQKFINILDRSPDLNFSDLVARLQGKWKSERVYAMMGGERANLMLDNDTSEDDDDKAFFNSKQKSSSHDKKGFQRRDTKQQPCFRERDNQDCPYGSDCKYSHDPAVLSSKFKKAFMVNQLRESNLQLALLEQANAALKSKRNLWKKKFRAESKKPAAAQRGRHNAEKKKLNNVTFEQATADTKFVASAVAEEVTGENDEETTTSESDEHQSDFE